MDRTSRDAVPRFAGTVAFLVSQVGAESAYRFGQLLTGLGVTPKAFAVLATLEAAGTRTQQQLADALGIHRNNMVSLIDEMSDAGWVRRSRNRMDRRAFDITVTASGRRLVARVTAIGPGLDDELTVGLDEQERVLLAQLLSRVADGLGLAPGVHPHLGAGRTRERAT